MHIIESSRSLGPATPVTLGVPPAQNPLSLCTNRDCFVGVKYVCKATQTPKLNHVRVKNVGAGQRQFWFQIVLLPLIPPVTARKQVLGDQSQVHGQHGECD